MATEIISTSNMCDREVQSQPSPPPPPEKMNCLSRYSGGGMVATDSRQSPFTIKIPHDLCFPAADCRIMTVSVGPLWNSKWELEMR